MSGYREKLSTDRDRETDEKTDRNNFIKLSVYWDPELDNG